MELTKRNESDLLISKEVHIQAKPEVVFSVLENIQLFVELEENVCSVEITSEVKSGIGMKSHWELEDPATKERWSVDEEVIAYNKPFLFTYKGRAADGKDYTGTHELTDCNDGTTILRFSEIFHFPGDPQALDRVVDGMVQNVKRYAEKETLTQ